MLNQLRNTSKHFKYNHTLYGSNKDPSNVKSNSNQIIDNTDVLDKNQYKNNSSTNISSINKVNSTYFDILNNATDSNHDPFNIFNENSIRNLGLVNRFIIRPAYEALKLKLENSISDNLKTFRLIYIIIISIFIAGVLFIYLFLWRRFENRLNNTVMI